MGDVPLGEKRVEPLYTCLRALNARKMWVQPMTGDQLIEPCRLEGWLVGGRMLIVFVWGNSGSWSVYKDIEESVDVEKTLTALRALAAPRIAAGG